MFHQINTMFQFGQNALNLLAYKQKILAANIANVDTPNYQALDFNFKDELDQKITQNKNKKLYPLNTSDKHLYFYTNKISTKSIHKNKKNIYNQSNNETNNVNINQERINFINNALKYQIQMIFLNNEIKNIMTVIQGQ